MELQFSALAGPAEPTYTKVCGIVAPLREKFGALLVTIKTQG